MAGFLSTMRNLGPARMLVVLSVLAAVIGFLIFITTRVAAPNMTLLYSELDLSDSGQIVSKLDGMKVPYEIRDGGAQVLVPSDQVAKLRMTMAQEGLPSGGNIGYEIFDRSETFGSSNFVQNINQLRALEGELSRTISALSDVKSARVHLVLPQRRLFSRDQVEPTASIVLKLKSLGQFDRQQVASIQHLVASAVPELRTNNISIVDDKGNLLARGGEEDGAAGILSLNNTNEMRINYESRLARQVETLLESSIGPGRVRAEVSADMNFDRITLNTETYDPDGQVVRSTQTLEEINKTNESQASAGVTVFNQTPQAEAQSEAPGVATSNSSEHLEETVNYEISRVVENKVREVGNVKRLSVAVLVDGNYTTDAEGNESYAPRSEEELEKLEKLVKSTIGFDEDRGDQLEIVNMQFATVEESDEVIEEPFLDLNKEDYLKLAELFVLGIVGILVILLVVRPMINRMFQAIPAGGGVPGVNPDTPLLSNQQKEGLQLGSADSGGGAAQAAPPEEDDDEEELINLEQIEGRVKRSAVKQIEQMVEKHPEEAVSIIRNWLYQTESQ